MSRLTTDPADPDLGRGVDRAPGGQHKAYLVLSEEERAKGFVRPMRATYVHVGTSICAQMLPRDDKHLGGPRDICALPHGHIGKCGDVSRNVTQREHAAAEQSHLWGGCGTATMMGRALAETYARDPRFYGATFCVWCGRHLPVGEFEWEDGEVVGS